MITRSIIARAAALLATTSLLPIATAHAETADASASESSGPEILVTGRSDLDLKKPTATGSRLGLTSLETPASVYVVDGAAIHARGDLTINDAVTRAPGMTSNASIGDGNSGLASRGFTGSGSVMQMVDGVRQFPNNGTLTFPSDPWNVDRIEVLTGPASVLYGQGALGGAINVVTKQPTEEQQVDLEASYGSQDTAHLAAGAGGKVAEGVTYRVDGSYRRSDGYVDRGDSHSLVLSGALKFAPTDNFSVTMRVDYSDSDPMAYTGTPLINGKIQKSTRHNNYNVADADIDWRDDRETLTLKWSPSENVTFTNTAYRLGSNRRWYDLEYYSSTGTGTIARSGNYAIKHDIEQLGDQATVALSTPFGGSVKNDLVVGFDVNSIDLDYADNFAGNAQEDEVDTYNPVPGTMVDRYTRPDFKTRTREWAVFGEDRLKLNEQISIIGGFRYEEDRVHRITYVYSGDTIVGQTNVYGTKVYRNFTWRVGGVFQPTSNISLYGQYSTGVDPIASALTSVNGGNVAYKNATGHQIEFGVKASFLDGRGSATLSAYKIVKNDLVLQRTSTSPIQQVGQRSSKGIEAAISVALPAGFGIEANGTILDAKYDDFVSGGNDYTGNTPSNVPEQAANAWLTWQGLQGKLRTQVGLRYVGRRFSDDGNEFRIPAYAVVDAGISYAFTENLAVDLRAYNLFDKIYAISAYENEQWVLGRPQSFDVAVRAKF